MIRLTALIKLSCFAILVTIAWSASSSIALAKSCNKRLVVMEFLGPQNDKVRTAVVRTLQAQGCDLVKSSTMDDTARQMGLRMTEADDFAKVAKKLKAQGYVEGVVTKKKRNWTAEVSIRNGKNGELIKSTSWTASSHRALTKQVQRNSWQRLGGAVSVAGTDAASEQSEDSAEVEEEEPQAEPTGIRVAVLRVRGAMASKVRTQLENTLRRQGHDVLPSAEVDAVTEALIDSPTSSEDYQQLAAELKVHAVVVAHVRKDGKAYIIDAEAHSGRDGKPVIATTGVTRNKDNIGSAAQVTAERISPKLKNAKLPSRRTKAALAAREKEEHEESSSEEEDEEEAEQDETTDSDSGAGKYVALDASIGPRVFSRSLSYTDNIFNSVRGYSVFPAFAIDAGLTWFPGAHFTDTFWAHIGLTGSFTTSIGLNSSVEGTDVEFPTTAKAYSIGAIGRLPLGALTLTASGSYGSQSFEIEHGNALTPKPADIPNVDYKYMRLGVGMRWEVDDHWSVLGGLGYRFVLSAGELEDDFFPRMSAGALDMDIGAAYRLIGGFELRLILDMQRYFMSMNPEVGDPYVAGGAVDQWFGATLAAAYRL